MSNEQYEFGTLIWADFGFNSDDDGKEHPAIVLVDRGAQLVVLSGTSWGIPEHLFIRNENFTFYSLNPHDLPFMKNGLTQETFFDLTRGPFLISKDIISRISEVLDSSSIDDLMGRTAIKLFFSGSFSSDVALKNKIVCWREEVDDSLRLDELRFAIVLGKMKSGRLKVLSELKPDEKVKNHLYLNKDIPVEDLQELLFHSVPSFLEKEKVCFISGILKPDHLNLIKKLPIIKVNSRKQKFNPEEEDFQLGDIICAKDKKTSSFENPLMVVGMDNSHSLLVVRAKQQKRRLSPYIECREELPGFAKSIEFNLKMEPFWLRINKIKYKFEKSKLSPERKDFIEAVPTIRALINNDINAKKERFQIGDILSGLTDKYDSVRTPLLVVGLDSSGSLFVIKGGTEIPKSSNIESNISLRGIGEKVSFDLKSVPIVLLRYQVRFKFRETTDQFSNYLSKQAIVKNLKSL